jgi:S1-C subfamily serine protease
VGLRVPLRRGRAALRVLLVALVGMAASLFVWIHRLNRQVGRLEAQLLAVESDRREFEARVEEQRKKTAQAQGGLQARIAESRRREEELSRRLQAGASGSEVGELREELLKTRGQLAALAGERAIGERIIREYGGGVCLIQGMYAFFDRKGRPLRYRIDEKGQRVREADGSIAVDVLGDGPIHSVDYVGSGFLVDRSGLVVTNRHIAEPWWRDATAKGLAQQGYEARFLKLRAFFPGVAEALDLRPLRVSNVVDLALLQANVDENSVPVLPLETSDHGAVPGAPVVVVGYPSGFDAILAKTDSGVVETLLSTQGSDIERLAETLANKGLIRPSTTQGHIGDVTATDIVFDAATTQGGSGGPVFNKSGRVIAVGYAVLGKGGGSTFGLPVAHVLALLKAQAESQRAAGRAS